MDLSNRLLFLTALALGATACAPASTMPSTYTTYTQDEPAQSAATPTNQTNPTPARPQPLTVATTPPPPAAKPEATPKPPTPAPLAKAPVTPPQPESQPPASSIKFSEPSSAQPESAPQAQPAPKKAPAPVVQTAPKTFEQELLMMINESRAQAGIAPLRLNKHETQGDEKCVGSYGHSLHMQQAGEISHDQFPGDICVPTSAWAENVGRASGDEESALMTIHNGMMAEKGAERGHLLNIMNPNYDSVGIGLYYKNGMLWLTEDFMYLGVNQVASSAR